ncbi:MAG: hypothetical protein HFG57_07555 [Lachnospiraceae bacterium]|nr:hypothetical protein [Lachnospiraceae bacterium]
MLHGSMRTQEENRQPSNPEPCVSCGGQLTRKNPYLYQCTSCKRTYYISANRTHKVSVQVSAGRLIVLCAGIVMAITVVAMAGYQWYTGRLVASASRFSVVFRDFLMEVYEKPVAEISSEDLENIRYLKIEKEKKYRFTYSFEDYYDDRDAKSFARTLQVIEVAGKKEDFSPTNVQYFTGLTRLELYTEGWENYILPENNMLRGIVCVDGLSKYGNPQFFTAINPDTLEEVAILGTGERKDFSFLEYLQGVKRLVLSEVNLEDGEILDDFKELEELYLYYVGMKEEEATEIIEEFLSLSSLKHFYIEGKTAWYITKEQWANWEETYGNRILLERK